MLGDSFPSSDPVDDILGRTSRKIGNFGEKKLGVVGIYVIRYVLIVRCDIIRRRVDRWIIIHV